MNVVPVTGGASGEQRPPDRAVAVWSILATCWSSSRRDPPQRQRSQVRSHRLRALKRAQLPHRLASRVCLVRTHHRVPLSAAPAHLARFVAALADAHVTAPCF